jgi:hypothetical protein
MQRPNPGRPRTNAAGSETNSHSTGVQPHTTVKEVSLFDDTRIEAFLLFYHT